MKKINRLKKSHEIASIVQKKKRVVRSDFIVYFQPSIDGMNRIAVSVSKKYGNAVERNHIKRVVREIIRPSIHDLAGVSAVVVIKGTCQERKFLDLKSELLEMLRVINQKVQGEKNEIKTKL